MYFASIISSITEYLDNMSYTAFALLILGVIVGIIVVFKLIIMLLSPVFEVLFQILHIVLIVGTGVGGIVLFVWLSVWLWRNTDSFGGFVIAELIGFVIWIILYCMALGFVIGEFDFNDQFQDRFKTKEASCSDYLFESTCSSCRYYENGLCTHMCKSIGDTASPDHTCDQYVRRRHKN